MCNWAQQVGYALIGRVGSGASLGTRWCGRIKVGRYLTLCTGTIKVDDTFHPRVNIIMIT